jgi:high-affinity iron transporter
MASPGFANEPAKQLLALVDYIGGDYRNAVQAGKIINQDEYAEMQEFAKRIVELLDQLKATDKSAGTGIEADLQSLVKQIANKGDAEKVAELADSAKENLIATYKIVPHPKQLPSLANGRNV